MKPILIKVSQYNINAGIEGDCFVCPIALAFVDAGMNCVVTGDYIRVRGEFKGGYGKKYKTPVLAQEFVRRFDRGGSVSPFQFVFDWSPYRED